MTEIIPHLEECIDISSAYAQKYIKLVVSNKINLTGFGHHIVPAAFYKYVLGYEKTRTATSPDMDSENIVNLSKQDHILAHYLLAKCVHSSNKMFKDSQIYAFVRMFSKKVMSSSPYLHEMQYFYDKNKSIIARYKQYDKNPKIQHPALPKDCTYYRDNGNWVTQVKNGIKEHYAFDILGNCVTIDIENLPTIWLWRNERGELIEIQTKTPQSIFCDCCYKVANTHLPSKRFIDDLATMDNYLRVILTYNEYTTLWNKFEFPNTAKPVTYKPIPIPHKFKELPSVDKYPVGCEPPRRFKEIKLLSFGIFHRIIYKALWKLPQVA